MTAAVLVFMGFIFVDDTDLLVIFGELARVSPRMIAEITQWQVSAWQGGLQATGGALHPDKCMWALVHYIWWDGTWKYWEYPAMLYVNDFDGNPMAVTRYNSSMAIKVVGVHQALDGNIKTQLQVLKDQAKEWGAKIQEGCLPWRLAHQGVHSMIWASLKYPLPATTFTYKQGSQLSSILFTTVLPKLGAFHSYPKVYRYAPTKLQGLALPHAKIDQEIDHLWKVITHGAIDTPTGFLL